MITDIFRQQLRFLAFRNVNLKLNDRLPALLCYVFLITWLVGIGRYWDHPSARSWQYAGLGSVFYIVGLSTFVYLIVAPLRPRRWSYSMVLVFVGFTSLPALLYAIPVERFVEMSAAQSINAWFLAVVAIWRVALYVRFLWKGAGLEPLQVFVATVLPLSVIVASLAYLNLEHVIFELMAGIRPEDVSPHEGAYIIVYILGFIAYLTFPITLGMYLFQIYRQYKPKTDE